METGQEKRGPGDHLVYLDLFKHLVQQPPQIQPGLNVGIPTDSCMACWTSTRRDLFPSDLSSVQSDLPLTATHPAPWASPPRNIPMGTALSIWSEGEWCCRGGNGWMCRRSPLHLGSLALANRAVLMLSPERPLCDHTVLPHSLQPCFKRKTTSSHCVGDLLQKLLLVYLWSLQLSVALLARCWALEKVWGHTSQQALNLPFSQQRR